MLIEIKEIKENNYKCITDSNIYHLNNNNLMDQWELQPWENYTSHIKNARKIYKFEKTDFPSLESIKKQIEKYF